MFRFNKSPENNSRHNSSGERREVFSDRDKDLRELLSAYDNDLSAQTQSYEDRVESLSHTAVINESTYLGIVTSVDLNVTKSMQTVAETVPALLREYARIGIENLSERDKAVFTQAASIIASVGSTDDFRVKSLLEASTPTARAAMEAAFDDFRFTHAKERAKLVGTANYFGVQSIIETASTPTARAAMKAAFDGARFTEAKEKATLVGSTDYFGVQSIIETASTPTAQKAIKAAFDGFRFIHAKEKATLVGTTDYYGVISILESASSRKASAVMEKLINDSLPKSRYERSYTDKSEDASVDEMLRKLYEEMNRKYGIYDDDAGQGPYAHDIFGAAGKPGSGSGHASAPNKQNVSPKVEKAKRIIASTAANKNYSWFKDVQPQDVIRVLNTAAAIRTKAIDKGNQEPDDAKIYRKYRQKSELLHDDPSHPIHTSVQILDALMGGDLKNGRLPRL